MCRGIKKAIAAGGKPCKCSFLICFSLLAVFSNRFAFVGSFSPTEPSITGCTRLPGSFSQEVFGESQQQQQSPRAVLLVGSSEITEEEQRLVYALKNAGYETVEVSAASRLEVSERTNDDGVYLYELSRATGMLKLVFSSSEGGADDSLFDPPTWVPMVRGEENVLVANGWSFLDPDESEPMSAYDIDDANAEAEYKPKWGGATTTSAGESTGGFRLSSIGYDLTQLSKERVLSEADSLSASSSSNQISRDVLLNGKTDPPNSKVTCNGYDFKGSAGQSDIPEGIFCTAIGGLPLFSSKDLSPTTASSGWLSFGRPLDAEHVLHTQPDPNSIDQRIEVVCARSRCHLGHYFGPTEGYCINASALRFVSSAPTTDNSAGHETQDILPVASRPLSWRPLDEGIPQANNYGNNEGLSPSLRVLKAVLEQHGRYERIVLGCGCFWHVEEALRNLQGVVETQACYAGGHTSTAPTYRGVCEGTTGHAEVVSVTYDPQVCPTNVLVDCFLAMHDPTMVKAHGKHSLHTGQYRSCVFVENEEAETIARRCLEDCRQQLGKELSTEIRNMVPKQGPQQIPSSFGEGWCWKAEDEHQRHDERIRTTVVGKQRASPAVLPATEWVQQYGRRTPSIMGGSLESALDPEDDGMAMMMI